MPYYQTANSTAVSYSDSLTGVPSTPPNSSPLNEFTGTAYTSRQSTAKAITMPVASRTGPDQMTATSVIPQAVVPFVTPDSPQQTVIPLDSYRYGNFSGDTATGDSLQAPRVLGEQPDTIAALSLTAEVQGQNLTSFGNNISQQISNQNDASQALFQPFSGSIISAYSRFFLQNVQEAEQEKLQIVETFTAFYVFFYGKKPPVYRYSGMLLNDENHKWTNDMKFFYENYFRGTKSVELGAQAVMSYDGAIVSGFLIDMSVGKSADLDKGAPFSFSMVVTDHTPAYFSADIDDLINAAQTALANQAAIIQQQLAAINSGVPSQQYTAAMQVCNNAAVPASVAITGSAPTGPQAFTKQGQTTLQFNA
jgi:hypothetical protein